MTLVAGTVISIIARDTNIDAITIGAASGAVGAWASMLQRASRLELGPFETPAHLGQDVEITVRLTRRDHGQVSVVFS